MKGKMKFNWKTYEWAVFNRYYDFYPDSDFTVKYKFNTKGKSGALRKFDLVIINKKEKRIEFAIECKRHIRKLDIKIIDSFFGMLEDVGVSKGIIISPIGFSKSAEKSCYYRNILPIVFTKSDEKYMIEQVANLIFPFDTVQHYLIKNSSKIFFDGNLIELIEEMDNIMVEEWEKIIDYFYILDANKCIRLLKLILLYHYDSGWRYHALEHLIDYDKLDEALIKRIRKTEEDIDVLELLTI